jgi:DNA-binding LacI/PurR family transcriptional regulator
MRIAFLINDLLGGYQDTLWSGIRAASRDLGIQVLTIPGKFINSSLVEHRTHSCLFDLLSGKKIDGFVMTATTFGAYNTMEQISAFCESFSPMPYTSIGVKLPGHPAVLVDNSSGLYDMISHLIKVHGYRDLGFIRGPANNPEAEIRYASFQKALRDNNLPLVPEWVREGDFQPDAGYLKAKEIWQNPRKPRALLAANDQMIIGAMRYLEEQKVSFPDEVALGGFDDITESRFARVPLTTVRQPIAFQAYSAVKLLKEYIDQKRKPDDITLPTEAVFRESCGCFSRSVMVAGMESLETAVKPVTAAGQSVVMDPADFRTKLDAFMKEHFQRDLGASVYEKWIVKLLETLKDFAASPGQDKVPAFLQIMGEILEEERLKSGIIEIWADILSGIRYCFKRSYPGNMENVGVLIQKGYILISEKMEQVLTAQIYDQSSQFVVMQQSLQRIMQAADMSELLVRLQTEIKAMNFDSFYLVFFRGGKIIVKDTSHKIPRDAVLKLAYRKGSQDASADQPFQTLDLLPDNLLDLEKSPNIIIQMLVFDDQLLGYILNDASLHTGNIHESFRSQISSSIRAGNLIEDMRRSQSALKKRNEDIQELLVPILNAIDEVTQITNEKMKTMEQTVDQIGENKKTFVKTSESVENIAESARYMMDLIKMIDDISERINILSINASIESARAGQHGRGFGVIAGEVRKLADSTADNATQTSETLKQVVESIKVSKISSHQSMTAYGEIQEEIARLSESLEEIRRRMGELSEFSRRIMSLIEN